MQHKPHLVGAGLRARRSVGGKMCIPALDVVLSLTTCAIDLFLKMLAACGGHIGDDEAGSLPIDPTSTRATTQRSLAHERAA